MTGIQFRAVGAGAAAAALLGLARFAASCKKSYNFNVVSNDLRRCKRGTCPHTPLAGMLHAAYVCCQTNQKLLLMGLQLQYVCSLGSGSMCNSYDVVHVLTFWCNYICNAPPKGLTVGNH